jgi:hypothetical protein
VEGQGCKQETARGNTKNIHKCNGWIEEHLQTQDTPFGGVLQVCATLIHYYKESTKIMDSM